MIDHARAIRAALTDPRSLCERLGFEVSRSRRQASGVYISCPWHEDSHPSCSIRVAADNTIAAKCHSCDASGDALSLIAVARGLDMRTAFADVLREAAALAGYALPNEPRRGPAPVRAPLPRRPIATPKPTAPSDDGRDHSLTIAATTVAPDHELATSVRSYLDGRHLLAEAVEDGWTALDHTELRYQLDERISVEGVPLDLAAVGLVLRGDDGWFPSKPLHRLVIPWRRPDGTLHTIQRRDPASDKQPKYVFPKGRPPAWPYGAERIAAAPVDAPVVWVEGAVDALARRALDRRAGQQRIVLGVPGTDGWHASWAELGRGRVNYVATDADDAGDKAAPKWAADLWAAGATNVIRLAPRGVGDWAEVLAA